MICGKGNVMADSIVELKQKYFFMETVTDAVFHVLYEAIEKGILKPGDRILEVEVANTLEVSRTPVREATRQLVAEGLAVYSSHGSICVREFTLKEIYDYIQAMELLRNITTKEAAERISRIDLSRLKKIIEEIDSLPGKYPDPDECASERFKLDEKFHQYICVAADNHYLIECYDRLDKLMNVIFKTVNLQEMMRAYSREADQERKDMFEALVRHDSEEALRISLKHSQRVFDRLKKISE